jgi:hypothetical protein
MNTPTRVDLLDANHNLIFSVTESQPGSLNGQGSERTRYLRIVGPAGSVVTAFDDQHFRRGQNAVSITKEGPADLVVPIATNFVNGNQRNGTYFGSQPGYQWMLMKAINQSWWAGFLKDTVNAVEEWLKADGEAVIVELAGGVVGYLIDQNTNTSNNNHVDNLSSIALGMPLPQPS